MTNFKCDVIRTSDKVEVHLDGFNFAVQIKQETEPKIRLANGIIIGFQRPEENVNSIRVFLQHGEKLGQRVRLDRENEVRTVSISDVVLRENCSRQLAARRISQYFKHLVHVNSAVKLVFTTQGTAKAKFKNRVAICSQGPKNAEGSLNIIYVRESATDEHVAVALIGRRRASELPKEQWVLAMQAYARFTAAEQIAAIGPLDYTNHEWLCGHAGGYMGSVLRELLAIWGPRLIAQRVAGRAKDFLNCFQFDENWRPNGKSWFDRLQELPSNPWKYLKKYYRVRGVTSGQQTMLWITTPEDTEFKEESDFYDSTSDKSPWLIQDDLGSLFHGRNKKDLGIKKATRWLICEPLVKVVGWHDTPATVKKADTYGESGTVNWNGKEVMFGRERLRTSDLTHLGGGGLFELFAMHNSYQVTGGCELRDVEQLWIRGQLTILNRERYRLNHRLRVIRVLKDGDPAGVIDEHRILSEGITKLTLLLLNGEGDHLVVSFDSSESPRKKPQLRCIGKAKYKLVFRGSRHHHTLSSQARREHVFVERVS